ncbi:hypothetical protein FNL56_08440 [Tardiphaga sp. vice304]|uniref:hypothetical protein n=1 Tax=unclassified Tardiphaga TaxID=2631404 RepID=UPI001162205F|nr:MULTISPECIES: hypothetical protein [unclassified Tardiphaga]QDM15912.1 hypothetical protein FNL53_08355 [Tardiphaga sp. vice278]QDM26109.1 hypothetical protein FNL56_08440 [Tardiphaga sp. vice304]
MKRCDLRGQKVERQRLAAGNLDRPAPQPAQIPDLRFHPLGVGNLAADSVRTSRVTGWAVRSDNFAAGG